jgi:hypothetical protein
LDVKVKHRDTFTRPPDAKSIFQETTMQKIYQEQSESGPKTSPSRARGRSAIPQRPKFDFSELENMSEEQIMQLIYSDPELVAAAAAAADRDPSLGPSSAQSGYKRSSDWALGSQPDRLQAMREEGVPVKQWIVLLILLGFGIYQLRKAKSSSKTKKAEKTAVSRKSSKLKAKKGKPPGSYQSSASPPRAEQSSPIERELSMEEAHQTHPAPFDKKVASLSNKKKSKARKQKPAVGAGKNDGSKPQEQQPAPPSEHPDTVSTDGSSSTTDAQQNEVQQNGAQHELQLTRLSALAENVNVDTSSAAEEDDGWKTVGTSNTTKQKVKLEKNGSDIKKAPSAQDTSVSNVDKTADDTEAAVAAGEEEELVPELSGEMIEEVSVGSKVNGEATATSLAADDVKKDGALKENVERAEPSFVEAPVESSNKEEDATITANEITVDSIDLGPLDTTDDEAIAKKLQLEEEKLAKHEEAKASFLDTWEEVPTKKKKRVSTASPEN